MHETLNQSWWETNTNKLALIALETQIWPAQIKQVNFSLSLVSKARIQALNKHYRKHVRTTDVLSFPVINNFDLAIPVLLLGDIVICLPKLLEQAQTYGHSPIREAAFLFVHGFLHLLHYDHQDIQAEEEMFALQDIILGQAGFWR